MQIEALCGHVGMLALWRAFAGAGPTIEVKTLIAVPIEGRGAFHLLFTIGDTTAALSLSEVQWFADQLMHPPRGMGEGMAGSMEALGRMMLSMLVEAPGPHGVH